MHVFIITQYFPPEIGASATRWGDYTEILIKQNHRVTILCESPHYPNSSYFSGYKNLWCSIEKKSKNLTIIRSKAFASDRKTFYKKLMHYFVFMISSTINSRKVKNYDLLIISSPPLFTGVIGLFIKKFYRSDFWLDIRDLWPESALELGQIKKGILYKLGKKLESKIYQSAKGFIFPVPGFKFYLKDFSNKISKKPMIELMNGVSEDFIKKSQKINISNDQKFTVLYSGNMGLAQDLNTIIKAAEYLKDYNIDFRLIGEGVCKSEIEMLAKPYKEKIHFHRSLVREDLIKWIKKSSVCLVPLKNKKLFNSALPSKMFEYMACAKPIIVGVNGEAKKIVNSSGAGIAIEPEDPIMLSKAILTYFNNKEKCKTDGQNGMTYITKKLSKEMLISNLINHFKK
ncbi:MAG: hypothetical protein CMG62_09910 [Candidatus Marinimicrobia bacterium]|nr:hypothetical protein [Candidatus Neomarinimicrobiota bacterium]|tara:strand:+ start:4943 stop:6142 length:1200 start_codon:yes stop_codon:yes gene_type:complete